MGRANTWRALAIAALCLATTTVTAAGAAPPPAATAATRTAATSSASATPRTIATTRASATPRTIATTRATATRRATTTPRATATRRATATARASATPRRTATPRATLTARPTVTARATATPRQPSASGAACLRPLAESVQADREINEAVSDLAGAIDCLVQKGDAPTAWRGDLFVRLNGVQRFVSRSDHRSTDRMLKNTVLYLDRLGRKERDYANVAGQLQSATERLARRVGQPDRAGL
jgi:hypothetical protein